MEKKKIIIYTDGSCNPKIQIGGWAAIIFIDEQKIILKETIRETSHNRMELMAVIKAIEYIDVFKTETETIQIFSDSQYVINLRERKEKLRLNNYLTKKGTSIKNIDLVQKLIDQMETHPVTFVKVKAHQKQSETVNYNREVDKIVRKMVRSEENRLE
ncbi:MAG: ribonuclease HI [Bacteroidota bacterium]|nr:ribonuclease HI [Bacteroidota bacterium]